MGRRTAQRVGFLEFSVGVSLCASLEGTPRRVEIAQMPSIPQQVLAPQPRALSRCQQPEYHKMLECFPGAHAMEITLTIPDELARQIIPEGLDPSRLVLEDVAVEAYRAHRLTGAQLRRVLGIPSRY